MSKQKQIVDNLANTHGFGDRLRNSLGGGGFSEIIRRLNEKDIKIDYDTLRRYILEERKPDIDTLIKLADFAGVSLDWILKGDDSQIKYLKESRIKEIYNELNESIWSELSLNDLWNIDRLAKSRRKTLSRVVRELVVEGLNIRGVMEKKIPLNFVFLSDYLPHQLCEIECWGKVAENDEFIDSFEMVKIPKQLVASTLPSNWIEKKGSRIHAYRICGNNLIAQGIHAGDIIVAGIYKKLLDGNWAFASIPAVIQPTERNILLRRIYKDPLNDNKMLACPLKTLHPIEHLTKESDDLEVILAIVSA